jgi:hypothetical protein
MTVVSDSTPLICLSAVAERDYQAILKACGES